MAMKRIHMIKLIVNWIFVFGIQAASPSGPAVSLPQILAQPPGPEPVIPEPVNAALSPEGGLDSIGPPGAVGSTERRFACWGSFGPPVVSAQCPRGTSINIIRAGLKVKVAEERCVFHEEDCGCEYGDDGCNMPDVRKLCGGRSACRLDVTQQYINTNKCSGFSGYMFIDFKCVETIEPPPSEDLNICTNMISNQESGYIHSPNYPNEYPANQRCQCTLSSPAFSSILLSVLDFHVDDFRCKQDVLQLKYAGHTSKLCGHSNGLTNHLNSDTNHVQLIFSTDSIGSAEGFWIKYQAEPASEVIVECSTYNRHRPAIHNEHAVEDPKAPRPGPVLHAGMKNGIGGRRTSDLALKEDQLPMSILPEVETNEIKKKAVTEEESVENVVKPDQPSQPDGYIKEEPTREKTIDGMTEDKSMQMDSGEESLEQLIENTYEQLENLQLEAAQGRRLEEMSREMHRQKQSKMAKYQKQGMSSEEFGMGPLVALPQKGPVNLMVDDNWLKYQDIPEAYPLVAKRRPENINQHYRSKMREDRYMREELRNIRRNRFNLKNRILKSERYPTRGPPMWKREPKFVRGEQEHKELRGEREPKMVRGEREPNELRAEREPKEFRLEREPKVKTGPKIAKAKREPNIVRGEREFRVVREEREPKVVRGEREPNVQRGEREPELVQVINHSLNDKPDIRIRKLSSNKPLEPSMESKQDDTTKPWWWNFSVHTTPSPKPEAPKATTSQILKSLKKKEDMIEEYYYYIDYKDAPETVADSNEIKEIALNDDSYESSDVESQQMPEPPYSDEEYDRRYTFSSEVSSQASHEGNKVDGIRGLSKAQRNKLRMIHAQMNIIRKQLAGAEAAKKLASEMEQDAKSSVDAVTNSLHSLNGLDPTLLPSVPVVATRAPQYPSFHGKGSLPEEIPSSNFEQTADAYSYRGLLNKLQSSIGNEDTSPNFGYYQKTAADRIPTHSEEQYPYMGQHMPAQNSYPLNEAPDIMPYPYDAGYPNMQGNFYPANRFEAPTTSPVDKKTALEKSLSKRISDLLAGNVSPTSVLDSQMSTSSLLYTTLIPTTALVENTTSVESDNDSSEDDEDSSEESAKPGHKRKVKILRKKKILKTTQMPSSEEDEEENDNFRRRFKRPRVRDRGKEDDEQDQKKHQPRDRNEGPRRFKEADRIDEVKKFEGRGQPDQRGSRKPSRYYPKDSASDATLSTPLEKDKSNENWLSKMQSIYEVGKSGRGQGSYPNALPTRSPRMPIPNNRGNFGPATQPYYKRHGDLPRHEQTSSSYPKNNVVQDYHASGGKSPNVPVDSETPLSPTGPQSKQEEEGDNLTVSIAAGGVVGALIVLIVVGLVIRHFMNKRQRENALRQRHKRECAMRRTVQQRHGPAPNKH